MEQCSKCKISKPRSEFYKDNNRKRGLSYWCKLCIKKWQKENKGLLYFNTRKNYDKKRKFYIGYKEDLECHRCGENHLACLEFHHRNPKEKDFEIGHAFSGHGIKLIMNEIAKCDVLCANCHKKLHYIFEKEVKDYIMEWYEKFKINQEVRVVKKVITWGLPKYGRGASWTEEMDETLGKIYKIINVDICVGYRLNTDLEHDYNYWFPIESLACANVKGEQLLFNFMR